VSTHRTALEKAEEVEEVKGLIQRHKVIGVAGLQKVRAAQLQELRRKLEGNVYLRVIKNIMVKRAIAKCEEKPRLKELEENLSGSNIYLFTNINPFELVLLLFKSRVKTTAKAGDIAAHDVIVPAGNTGLPPGPIIAQFGAIGLRTRIEAGSVWVNRDTLVAKKEDVITSRLASALSKLGIKSVEVGLTLRVAYDEGFIINEEQLQLDLEGVRLNIEEAYTRALNLSLGVAYPLPENIDLLLQMAHQRSYQLALHAGVFTPSTVVDLVRNAYTEMLSLISKLTSYKFTPE
jgi:large subunit ribosomal protein L10